MTISILLFVEKFYYPIGVLGICFVIILLYYIFYPAIVASRVEKILPQPIVIRDHDRNQKQTTTEADDDNNTKIEKPILSIIVPAYDEEERLTKMLQEAYNYLSQSPTCRALQDLKVVLSSSSSANSTTTTTTVDNNELLVVEWIVVNDGSKDRTSQVYTEFVIQKIQQQNQQHNNQQHIWKLIEFPINQGKGAAVQAGMVHATGAYCLMADADGATEFNTGLEALTLQLLKLQPATNTNNNKHSLSNNIILFGSRAELRAKEAELMGRSIIRTFISEVFRICVWIFVQETTIKDTQCGFKLLPRTAAQHIFYQLHLRRWAFDIELIYVANHLQYPIREIPLPLWQEVDGSKLHTSTINLALVSFNMLRDMICVRLCYTLGIWKIKSKQL